MFDLQRLIELSILIAAYWLFDLAIHRDQLSRLLSRIRSPGSQSGLLVWFGLVLITGCFWKWTSIPQWTHVRTLAAVLTGILSWKAVTRDVDPVTSQSYQGERLIVGLSCAGIVLSPVFLLFSISLLNKPFRMWEHHATFPMRVLQATSAWVCLASTASLLELSCYKDSSTLMFFLAAMQVSHYLITALAKGWLGPKWYSWVTDNKLHHLAASAYSWGWARFITWDRWLRFITVLRGIEKPAQLSAFAFELLIPLAFLHPNIAIGFCIAAACFHLGVFAVSGLLFWEWIITNLIIAWTLSFLPDSAVGATFGVDSFAVGIAFMLAFPLRHRLWKPMPLGWWDTPFTQRMHWIALGVSGRQYAIYNDFMCPHERLYGKVHACFMTPVAGFTYHLGEVWKHDLRDAIRNTGPDPARLDALRQDFGIWPRDDVLAANHIAYLRAFFSHINQRSLKHTLPSRLRWLKAPGGQCFYWGELEAFDYQEQIDKIVLTYREEYFDGNELRRTLELTVTEIAVPARAENSLAVSEPTPKQIDNLLLSHANGKIIDLPDFGSGYVHGDDGKSVEESESQPTAA